MKRFIALIFFTLVTYFTTAQDISNLSFGTDDTLEIVTWNIEQFPKNGSITINYVSDIIEALDADIIAIQEVDDQSTFNAMVGDLTEYNGYLESTWFAGLAYIYKSDTVEINSLYEIFTDSQYWNYFPRSPMVMDLNYQGERYIVINNHLKCCGDGILDIPNDSDEETRRYYANAFLREYVNIYFENENVIILGDLNDNLLDASANNVFQPFLNDNDNYLFVDYDIASGNASDWSFPSWPSHLDHIIITNELFDDFTNSASEIQTIKLEDYIAGGWPAYDQNISDHRPVALKLDTNSNLSITDNQLPKTIFTNYPNPFKEETILSFNSKIDPNLITIYNLKGQNVHTLQIPEGETFVKLNALLLQSGIYIAKLQLDNTVLANRKIVVIK